MISLVETGLMNALLAVCLALPLLILGRWSRRPALVHAFWILVLLKLVSPPLYYIPIQQLPLPAFVTALFEPRQQVIDLAAESAAPGYRRGNRGPLRVPPVNTLTVNVSTNVSSVNGPGGRSSQPDMAVVQTNPAEVSQSEQFTSAGRTSVRATVTDSSVTETATELAANSRVSASIPGLSLVRHWGTACLMWVGEGMRSIIEFLAVTAVPVLGAWFLGTIVWFGWQGWLVVRFAQQFLRSAQPASPELQAQAQELAQRMGLRRCPEVWLLPAVVSPMLWSMGGRARILFPRELLTRMDDCAVATLLTHELAHYRRGDHYVRLLEFVAHGIFWWHPVVWLARRELEISEEQCCDAWVVSQFPALQRRYADALLATVDFLSEEHPPVPAIACGLGDVPLLRQRLTMIMRGTAPKSLTSFGRFAVCAVALLIPISPSLQAIPDQTHKSSATPARHSVRNQIHERNVGVMQSRTSQILTEIDRLTRQLQQSLSEADRTNGTLGARPVNVPFSVTTFPPRSASRGRAAGADAAAFAVRRQSNPHVWANAVSPDGMTRIVAWTNGLVEWQRADNLEPVDLSGYRISTILFSADSEFFLSGCRDGIVRAWDSTTCELLFQLEGHQASVRALALSPDNTQLATSDQQGKVLLWSLTEPGDPQMLTQTCTSVNSLTFSADGQSLALGTGRWFSPGPAQVQVWDLETTSLRVCLDHDSALAVVRLSPDGKSVSGAAWNGTLMTWDLKSSAVLSKRFINRFSIPATAFAPQS